MVAGRVVGSCVFAMTVGVTGCAGGSGNTYVPGAGASGSGGASAGASGDGGGSGEGGMSTDGSGGAASGGVAAGGSGVSGSAGAGGALGGSGGDAGSAGAGGTAPSCLEGFVWETAEEPYAIVNVAEPFEPDLQGTWSTYQDGTGTCAIAWVTSTHPDGGTGAISCSGQGFTDWGAGCIVPFNPVQNLTMVGVNALAFWARATAAIELRVNIADSGSDPRAMICSNLPDCAVGNCCYDHYGKTLTLDTSWKRYELPFSELVRENNDGPPGPFDPTRVYEIDFRGPLNMTWEFFLDDLAFTTCTP